MGHLMSHLIWKLWKDAAADLKSFRQEKRFQMERRKGNSCVTQKQPSRLLMACPSSLYYNKLHNPLPIPSNHRTDLSLSVGECSLLHGREWGSTITSSWVGHESGTCKSVVHSNFRVVEACWNTKIKQSSFSGR